MQGGFGGIQGFGGGAGLQGGLAGMQGFGGMPGNFGGMQGMGMQGGMGMAMPGMPGMGAGMTPAPLAAPKVDPAPKLPPDPLKVAEGALKQLREPPGDKQAADSLEK